MSRRGLDAVLELVDVRQNLEELLLMARGARPEMAALNAEIARKEIQVRQERTRPLFPTVSLGFSAGSFGGGTNPAFGQFGGRTDIDLIAYWELQNLGMGNWALQKGRLSELPASDTERDQMANVINREVAKRKPRCSHAGAISILPASAGVAQGAIKKTWPGSEAWSVCLSNCSTV